MEKLQPKLRFPEFYGNWKLKKLGDIGSFIGGGTPSTSNEDFWKGDIPWISSSDIFDNEIQDIRISRFLTKEAINESATKIIPKNSILLVSRVGVGKLAINKVEVCTSQDFTNIIVSDDNSYFIGYNLISKKNILSNFSQGTSIKGFTSNDIKTLGIKVPSLPEQTKIANFLSSVDEKLNLLKEKKTLLEDYKKGIMQKIFNQEIRFKDDNGNDFEDWKESILSEVVNLFHGYQFRTSDFTSKGIAVIKISNVIGNNLDLNNLTFIKKERFEDFKNFEINNDDILMSLTGNIGRIIEVKDKPFSLLQNYRVGKFIPLNENIINKPFLKYLLASDLVFGRFSQLANQSAQANFGKQDMDKINISYPPIEEQTKIANFLSAIDEKIELVSNQIQDTQEYKKGLLQQMFV